MICITRVLCVQHWLGYNNVLKIWTIRDEAQSMNWILPKWSHFPVYCVMLRGQQFVFPFKRNTSQIYHFLFWLELLGADEDVDRVTWAELGKACRGAGGRGRGGPPLEKAGWEGGPEMRDRGGYVWSVKWFGREGDKQETPLCWWLQPFPVCVPVALPSFLLYPGSPRRIPALIGSAFVRVVSGSRQCRYLQVFFLVFFPID